jgi:hypothetical protein
MAEWLDLDDEGGRSHSRFAPSSMKRILFCPRSVALAEAIAASGEKVPRSSRYAAEGSVAHYVAETYLKSNTFEAGNAGELYPVGKVIEHEGHQITIDDDMHEHGAAYARYVNGLRNDDSKVFVETTVRLDEVVGSEADVYGHLDAAVWTPSTGILDVIDYKYGRGVKVSALDNPQLKSYGLGAIYTLPIPMTKVRLIRLHVFQPRIYGASPPDTIATVDLLMWGTDEMAPVIREIMRDGAIARPYVTGDHCQFCPALAHCPAMRERAKRAARKAFGAEPVLPAALTDAELADVLDELDVVKPWFAAAEEEGDERAIGQGRHIRGRKIVLGRGRRVFIEKDQKKLAQSIHALGINDIYEEPVLKSPTEIEKAVKKLPDKKEKLAKFKELVDLKPGAKKLVKASDPKPEVSSRSASEVFKQAA